MITSKENCCGCELCANICPSGAIQMKADDEGFFYPQIDSAKCTECDACKKMCPANREKKESISHNLKSFSAHCGTPEKLHSSASGGAAAAFAEKVIHNGGIVFGVKYSDGFVGAEYASAENLTDAEKFKGSKYVQSRKNKVYLDVLKAINTGREVLFVGLPCEVGALKSFLKKDYENLTTVELFCHGVTSPKTVAQFIAFLEKKYSSKLKSFTMRDKADGWEPPYIRAEFQNGKTYLEQYYQTKLGSAFRHMSRISCYHCRYKGDNRVGDISIGDCRGIETDPKHFIKDGVSAVLVNTQKGIDFIKELPADFVMYDISNELVLEHNQRVLTSKPYGIRDEYAKRCVKSGVYTPVKMTPRGIISRLLPRKIKKLIKGTD